MWDDRVTGRFFCFGGQLKEEFFVFYCFTREIGHVLLWNLA